MSRAGRGGPSDDSPSRRLRPRPRRWRPAGRPAHAPHREPSGVGTAARAGRSGSLPAAPASRADRVADPSGDALPDGDGARRHRPALADDQEAACVDEGATGRASPGGAHPPARRRDLVPGPGRHGSGRPGPAARARKPLEGPAGDSVRGALRRRPADRLVPLLPRRPRHRPRRHRVREACPAVARRAGGNHPLVPNGPVYNRGHFCNDRPVPHQTRRGLARDVDLSTTPRAFPTPRQLAGRTRCSSPARPARRRHGGPLLPHRPAMTWQVSPDVREWRAAGKRRTEYDDDAPRRGLAPTVAALFVGGQAPMRSDHVIVAVDGRCRVCSMPVHAYRDSLRHQHRQPEDAAVRFWRFVRKGAGCWEWTGHSNRPGGYGRFAVQATRPIVLVVAHRYSWELHFGPIPPGMIVCHRCDNPSCVRPDHLFLGTQSDNVRDSVTKGRHKHNQVPRTARPASGG